jgi:sterol desaturase/sphingolipid hydroxylase (fatty acid hydroxylase superfamily)
MKVGQERGAKREGMFQPTTLRTSRGLLPDRARAVGAGLARLFLGQPSGPWLPILLYGPVAVACVTWGLLGGAPAWALLLLPAAGFLVWTLLEYVLHSAAFHNPFGSPVLRITQAAHTGHHEDPKDPTLMVARLAFSLPIALVMFVLFWAGLRNLQLAGLMMAGGLIGYLAYEVVHFAIHRARHWRWLIRPLVKHHLYHHHKDSSRCYGVTSPLWDWVFRTGRPVRREPADSDR